MTVMKEHVLYKSNSLAIAVLFSAAVFLPFIVGIIEDDREVSAVEKRKLSVIPSVIADPDDIKKFPRLFDAYYSDHFGFRDLFNEVYKLIKFKIGDSPSEHVTIGNNGWLFLGSVKKNYNGHSDPMGDVRNINLYSNSELKEFAEYMSVVKQWLNEKGVKYVFVIAPNKHTVYYDMLPDYITRVGEYSAADQVVEYLGNNTNVSVVDLRSILIDKSKTVQTYYKTDTHWNHNGANVSQFAIMSQIEKMYPRKIVPEEFTLKSGARGGGDLSNFIGVKGFIENNPSPVFDDLCNPVKSPSEAKPRETHTYTCHNQELNALVFRDSLFTALQPYFARKFKRSTYIWKTMDSRTLKEYVEKEKPDIVIEEWAERSLPLSRKVPQELKNTQSKLLFECSDRTVYSNDFKLLKTNKHIVKIGRGNLDFKIKSVGNDPIIIFPQLDFRPGKKYIMHIEATVSVDSEMQIFYSDSDVDGYLYTEHRSIRYPVKSGVNDVYIILDYEKLGKHLRLDPISKNMGEVEIRKLEVKEFANNQVTNCSMP